MRSDCDGWTSSKKYQTPSSRTFSSALIYTFHNVFELLDIWSAGTNLWESLSLFSYFLFWNGLISKYQYFWTKLLLLRLGVSHPKQESAPAQRQAWLGARSVNSRGFSCVTIPRMRSESLAKCGRWNKNTRCEDFLLFSINKLDIFEFWTLDLNCETLFFFIIFETQVEPGEGRWGGGAVYRAPAQKHWIFHKFII